MRYFIVATLMYFCYSVVFAMDDDCKISCSQACFQQAVESEKELNSHNRVCRDEEPTLVQPVCAQACSKGCRSVMRGKRQQVVEYYEICGGGSGALGRLECLNTTEGFKATNTHSLVFLGTAHALKSACVDTIETLEENIFCAKSQGGYSVLSIMNDKLGISSSFLSQCVETLMAARNNHVCVRVSLNRFAAYNLTTMQKVGPEFSFLGKCKESL